MTDRPMLVTGADGMLGTALRRRFAGSSAPPGGVVWTDVSELDITDEAVVGRAFEQYSPAVVVNCAAFTDVDGAESRRETAFRVNGEAVGHLARAAARADCLLVQVSTDFVFSGEARRPYREDDPSGPLSAYAASKLEGEIMARTAPQHLVVRTSWLYGTGGRNFVHAICERLAESDHLRVVGDQVGCPTYTHDLAEAVARLLDAGARGTVHACGGDVTSWHRFAVAIAREVRSGATVEEITSAVLSRPARRPAYSVLDCSRLEELTGFRLPGYRKSLPKYLTELRGERCGGY